MRASALFCNEHLSPFKKYTKKTRNTREFCEHSRAHIFRVSIETRLKIRARVYMCARACSSRAFSALKSSQPRRCVCFSLRFLRGVTREKRSDFPSKTPTDTHVFIQYSRTQNTHRERENTAAFAAFRENLREFQHHARNTTTSRAVCCFLNLSFKKRTDCALRSPGGGLQSKYRRLRLPLRTDPPRILEA